MAQVHAEINGNDEEDSQDEEQEWDPSAAEFMALAIVYWFWAGRNLGRERKDFNILEIKTKLCAVHRVSRGNYRDGNSVPILVDAVLM